MDNRQIVKDFVSTWSDQKIAEVFAFNQDGKMDALSACNCLIGVASSVLLHQKYECHDSHYIRLKYPDGIAGGVDKRIQGIEYAYFRLGLGRGPCESIFDTQSERNRIFGEILQEVMAEREAARQGAPQAQETHDHPMPVVP